MDRCCRWLPEAIALAGVALGTAIAFRGWPVINVPAGMSGNLAEWAQVAGSVFAIIGAFMLGNRQHRNDRDRDAKAKLENEAALKSVVDLVSTVGCEVFNASQNDLETFLHKWRRALQSDCEVAIAAFDQIPLHQLGSAERIAHAFRIRNCVAHMMRLIKIEIVEARASAGIFKYWVGSEIRPQADALQMSMDGFAAQYIAVDQVQAVKQDHSTPPHAPPTP